MSALGHRRTHAVQQTTSLFEQFVRAPHRRAIKPGSMSPSPSSTVCFSSSQLDCGSQAFNQRCFVKRLAQKADRPAMERPIAVVLIWIGGNQNYWSATSLRSQPLLQLKAVEAGHL